jgi:hypothetical protein
MSYIEPKIQKNLSTNCVNQKRFDLFDLTEIETRENKKKFGKMKMPFGIRTKILMKSK